jgi:hypothetical protein
MADTLRTENRVAGFNAYPGMFHKPVGLDLDRESEDARSFRHNSPSSSEVPQEDRHVAVHAFCFSKRVINSGNNAVLRIAKAFSNSMTDGVEAASQPSAPVTYWNRGKACGSFLNLNGEACVHNAMF